MATTKRAICAAGATGLALLALTAPALAEDKFTYAITIGATSDYVFRGVSQTLEDPAFQAAVDVGYGMFYAGVWGSGIDFGEGKIGIGNGAGAGQQQLGPEVWAEIDIYAGIKPVWGPVTFDLGVIYYAYPNSDDWANFNHGCPVALPGQAACPDHIEYVELKAGYSLASPWIKGLTSGSTFFWSPDYSFETGDTYTLESFASYTLPQVWVVTPTISGTYGTVWGDTAEGFSVGGARPDLTGNEDEYSYWNVGLSLAVEKFTFDFRYWDSDIDVLSQFGSVCTDPGLCDERFVFSAKVVLP